jgi:hypothetical protein
MNGCTVKVFSYFSHLKEFSMSKIVLRLTLGG